MKNQMAKLLIDKEKLLQWMGCRREQYACEQRGGVLIRFYVYLQPDGLRYEVERISAGRVVRKDKFHDLDKAIYDFNEN